jgi:hypothetical protein
MLWPISFFLFDFEHNLAHLAVLFIFDKILKFILDYLFSKKGGAPSGAKILGEVLFR